jgi:hypothetical protein
MEQNVPTLEQHGKKIVLLCLMAPSEIFTLAKNALWGDDSHAAAFFLKTVFDVF